MSISKEKYIKYKKKYIKLKNKMKGGSPGDMKKAMENSIKTFEIYKKNRRFAEEIKESKESELKLLVPELINLLSDFDDSNKYFF